MSPGFEQLPLVGRMTPDARKAVGLQFEAHRQGVGLRPAAARCARRTCCVDAEQVLDVVADLVRDDVGLREIAGAPNRDCSSS